MKQSDLNKMLELSKEKKNGVHRLAGHFYYSVKDNNLKFIGERLTGKIFRYCNAVETIGRIDPKTVYKKMKELYYNVK